MRCAALIFALAPLPSGLMAQEAAPLTGKDVAVHLAKPSTRNYPEAALRRGLGGTAEVLCTVTSSGELQGCAVTSETPPGLGFGAAVLRMTAAYRIESKANDGSDTVGRRFLVHMTFSLPR
ncbi:TonB family protein [Phenylobacterium sp.]|jgi:TonB family protein|uniref:TonB family protein n=1 Tax=Phenylobacterium sp. TaxID=1871053 RepID=UPI0039C93A0F